MVRILLLQIAVALALLATFQDSIGVDAETTAAVTNATTMEPETTTAGALPVSVNQWALLLTSALGLLAILTRN